MGGCGLIEAGAEFAQVVFGGIEDGGEFVA